MTEGLHTVCCPGGTAESSAATAWLGKVTVCVAGVCIRARMKLGGVQCIVHVEIELGYLQCRLSSTQPAMRG